MPGLPTVVGSQAVFVLRNQFVDFVLRNPLRDKRHVFRNPRATADERLAVVPTVEHIPFPNGRRHFADYSAAVDLYGLGVGNARRARVRADVERNGVLDSRVDCFVRFSLKLYYKYTPEQTRLSILLRKYRRLYAP